MGRKRKQVDLAELVDKAQAAFARLHDAGYEDEVRIIQDFIEAEGNYFRESLRIHHDVQEELNKQLKAARPRRV